MFKVLLKTRISILATHMVSPTTTIQACHPATSIITAHTSTRKRTDSKKQKNRPRTPWICSSRPDTHCNPLCALHPELVFLFPLFFGPRDVCPSTEPTCQPEATKLSTKAKFPRNWLHTKRNYAATVIGSTASIISREFVSEQGETRALLLLRNPGQHCVSCVACFGRTCTSTSDYGFSRSPMVITYQRQFSSYRDSIASLPFARCTSSVERR